MLGQLHGAAVETRRVSGLLGPATAVCRGTGREIGGVSHIRVLRKPVALNLEHRKVKLERDQFMISHTCQEPGTTIEFQGLLIPGVSKFAASSVT